MKKYTDEQIYKALELIMEKICMLEYVTKTRGETREWIEDNNREELCKVLGKELIK